MNAGRDEIRGLGSGKENGTEGTGRDGNVGRRLGSQIRRIENGSIDRSIDGGDEKRAIHDAGRSGANQLVADVSTK